MGEVRLNDLWRVCRVLSQEGRLKLLWLLFENEEQCVSQLMRRAEMTRPNTSIQLKTLYLSGLIRFRREGMNVIYRAEADSRLKNSVFLLDALRGCFDARDSFESIIRQVTAFTHERRIEIVRALKNGPLSVAQLISQCGITSSALYRHLLKLESRNVVRWDGERYGLVPPKEQLGNVLLKLCVEGNGYEQI